MLALNPARLGTLLLAVLLAGPLAIITPTGSAVAAEEGDFQAELKDEWQRKYRRLLQEIGRNERNAVASRKGYMKANRRNYPRGAAREKLLTDAEKSEANVVSLQKQVEELKDGARAAGVRPGWLFDVEQEDFDSPMPAATASEDDVRDDREGRNPRFFDDDDDDG